jgi:hypothetical protein
MAGVSFGGYLVRRKDEMYHRFSNALSQCYYHFIQMYYNLESIRASTTHIPLHPCSFEDFDALRYMAFRTYFKLVAT